MDKTMSEAELMALIEILDFASRSAEIIVDVQNNVSSEQAERLELVIRGCRIFSKRFRDEINMADMPERDMLN